MKRKKDIDRFLESARQGMEQEYSLIRSKDRAKTELEELGIEIGSFITQDDLDFLCEYIAFYRDSLARNIKVTRKLGAFEAHILTRLEQIEIEKLRTKKKKITLKRVLIIALAVLAAVGWAI